MLLNGWRGCWGDDLSRRTDLPARWKGLSSVACAVSMSTKRKERKGRTAAGARDQRTLEGISLGTPATGHAGNLGDVGWEDDDYGEQGKKVGLNSMYGANRLMVERLDRLDRLEPDWPKGTPQFGELVLTSLSTLTPFPPSTLSRRTHIEHTTLHTPPSGCAVQFFGTGQTMRPRGSEVVEGWQDRRLEVHCTIQVWKPTYLHGMSCTCGRAPYVQLAPGPPPATQPAQRKPTHHGQA